MQGLLFIYRDFSSVFALQETLSNIEATKRQQVEAFRRLVVALCEVMLATFEGKGPQQVTRRHTMQYCQITSLDNILIQKDLFTAFPKPH